MRAVGVHVFAGGFTMGVQRAGVEVSHQLECHGFGLQTAREVCGVETVDCSPKDWPRIEADMAYGNPRCTGFSTVTAGYGEDTHGPWAKQCQDIHDLCTYAVGHYPIIIWESVQQAFSTGRPLLDFLRDDVFVPAGYRIAHVLLNAASFGNAQQRKRYFFVAYKNHLTFNVDPPKISPFYPVVYDALWNLRNRETNEVALNKRDAEYNFDSYMKLTDLEKQCVPILPTAYDLNMLAKWGRRHPDFPEKYRKNWETRTSDMPFSMHGIVRIGWLRPHPTIHSSACRFIHPWLHRPLTVGELATVMGWHDIPRGPMPVPQIAKGVCPEVGQWLAVQAMHCLHDNWGGEDFESSYDGKTGTWVGTNGTHDRVEKTFDLTQYVGQHFDVDRYDKAVLKQKHFFNVDPSTGRIIRPWKDLCVEAGVEFGSPRMERAAGRPLGDILNESTT